MTQFNTITEFNNYLVDNTIKKDLTMYIKEIHYKFYNNLDISFMDYFIKICQRENEFCVNPINEFINLKIKDKEIESYTLIKTLKRSNLIENEDYQILLHHVVEQDCKKYGGNNKKTYLLKPKAFKKVLIDIDDHKQRLRFIEYYLLLEECVSYYNTYQNQYQEKIINGITEDNKNLHVKMDEQTKKMDEQTKKMDELLNFGKATVEKLDATSTKLDESKKNIDELKENIENLDNNIDDLNDNIDDLKDDINNLKEDKHEKCNNDTYNHFFSLIKLDIKNYQIIRGTGKRNNQVIQKYNVEDIKINNEYTPNSITFFTRVKDELKEDLQNKLDAIKNNKKLKNKIKLKNIIKENVLFKIKNNKIILNMGSEIDLIEYLHKVNEKRKYDTTSD
jgi:archaellum component FlaC